jgi:hypothetical protein
LKLSASGGVGDAPRLFDTANPGNQNTCGDEDLGAPNEKCTPGGPGQGIGGEPGAPGENCQPQGNVLIVQEPGEDCPDDNVRGGEIVFEFDEPVEYVYEIGLLDMDYAATLEVTSSKLGGTPTVETIPITNLGDNSHQVVSIETVNVLRIKLTLERSGAVTFLSFCYPTSPTAPTPPAPAPTAIEPPTSSGGSACINTTINFDTLPDGTVVPAGEYISNQWLEAYGISFSSSGGLGDIPRIFDSTDIGNRMYGDPDLGTPNQRCTPSGPGRGEGGEPGERGENCKPQGNILIIQEKNANTKIPDDNYNGGSITITFEKEAPFVYEMGVLDIEEDDSYLSCLHSQSTRTNIPIEGYGNNAYQVIPIGIERVNQLVLKLKTSGAITHLTFCLAP